MGERKPTIEQNSQFTAKTKQGQDVEFQTTVKFYITPKGEVRVNVPGGLPGGSRQVPPGASGQPSASGGRVDDEAGSGQGASQGFLNDETIDSAFPRGPDCPCPKQFIPDPCKAMDDTVQSIKGFFSGSRQNAPQNVSSSKESEDTAPNEKSESNEN